jgi:hypothetical protein
MLAPELTYLGSRMPQQQPDHKGGDPITVKGKSSRNLTLTVPFPLLRASRSPSIS